MGSVKVQRRPIELASFEAVREFVRDVLCRRADVDNDAPLVETPLVRAGVPCGFEYVLWANRTIRLSAIWETVDHRVLFYDQNLERFQVTSVRGPEIHSQIRMHRPVPARLHSAWQAK
jgi:hypothetical protein